MRRIIATVTAFVLLLSCMTFPANAAEDATVTVRIEGVDSNIYYDTVSIQLTDSSTVADVLSYLDENNDDITITGLADGYIIDVNGESAGKFGGWDGWYYAVNDSVPEVGVSSCLVSDGDSIVLYYGDYPCQYPVADFSQVTQGIITFSSYEATYDENWNATYSWEPVSGATVTVGGVEYTSDENGQVTFDTTDLFGFVSVQIEKKSESGAPCVCRFASDYGFVYSGDINKDGKVNINDATAIQKYILNYITLDSESLAEADINGDGKVDVTDVTALQKLLVGLR